MCRTFSVLPVGAPKARCAPRPGGRLRAPERT
ncbi:MAG: hypothetical protein E6G19_06210 [Actinobacteria bacterium]|nr:MAG: hypothetical protein E6G19_06210 [Actinomycetota bacterium]